MILIIGGAAAGKREHARSLGYSDGDMSQNVWELLRAGADPDELLPRLLEIPVVICDEVGSGVVPISREERALRESCGRLCIELAARAERVIRIFCGIPTILK